MLISVLRTTPDAFRVYRMLLMIIVPISIGVECLARLGVIAFVSPVFAPLMGLFGLPPELGLAFLTALLVGLWAGIALLFTLVPLDTLSTADVTVFSALILFAHALPIEQKIIAQVGPRFLFTTCLRFAGGMLYALVLYHLLRLTGWRQAPVEPAWIPLTEGQSWDGFLLSLLEAMAWMGVILLGLFWLLALLRELRIIDLLLRVIAPILRLCGIHPEAAPLTTVGLLLGISYGAGPLVTEARTGAIAPRQIVLSCVFMGFAHSMIEDTILVIAIGADVTSVLVGRFIFAIVATAAIAAILNRIPDRIFWSHVFRQPAAHDLEQVPC